MTSLIADEALASLEDFAGELLRPGDGGYDEARRGYNGLIDRSPALIARCRGEADIAAAVAFAREAGLDVSIRGGGHSVAGRCIVDGGIVIDLSGLKGIFVDPEARTARVQPGVSWGELNREMQLHGLAVTGGSISTTGVAGLTLGGGLGWLLPKYGLATDNLLSARVVTADGRALTASESENADLFWGLRGGGGSFGVVSSFEFRLHPVGPLVTGGLVAHPIDAAEEFLRFYRDFAAGSSDDLMTFAVLAHAPDGSGAKLVACIACHVGEPDQAEEDIRPLREFGSPALVELGPMPYTVLNAMLDGNYPTGSLNYWKSGFLSEFSDAVIGEALERFAVCPSPMTSVLLRALPRSRDARSRRGDGGSPSGARVQLRDHVGLDRPGVHRRERRVDARGVRGDGAVPDRAQVRQLPRGRRRRGGAGAGRVRAELRAPGRGQGGLRPDGPLPPGSQRSAPLVPTALGRFAHDGV